MEAIHSRGVRDQCVLVSNAISHSILSLLGPGDRLKAFIDADGSGTLTRSVVKILDKLDVEDHPVGMAYKITCEGYVLYVGESGLCTLVTLIGLLVKKGNELESLGIPLINVVEGFRIAANVCEDILQSISIPFLDLTTPFKKPTQIYNWKMFSTNNEERDNSPLFNKQLAEGSSQLADMLSKLGVSLPPTSLPEMNADDDDVSWFFEDEADGTDIPIPSIHPSASGLDSTLNNVNTETNTNSNLCETDSSHADLLQIIGEGLARGNNDMMAIAAQVARLMEQDEDWNMRRLVLRRVPFHHASVTDGLLTRLRDDCPISSCSCSRSTSTQPHPFKECCDIYCEWKGKVCTVDGTVGDFELILGGVVRVVKAEDWEDSHREAEIREERYNQEVLNLLDANGVKLLATTGDVKQSLVELLHSRSIHVLSNIQGTEWDYFCYLTGGYPLGDVLDVAAEFLSSIMKIEHFSIGGKWEENKRRRYRTSDKEFISESYLRITPVNAVRPNPYFPISVALGGASKYIGEEKERQFWNCLHRLRNSVKQKKVLPGGGYPEMRCILRLEERAKGMVIDGAALPNSSLPSGLNYMLLEAEAVKGFAACLEEYLLLLAQNLGIPPQSSVESVICFKARIDRNLSERVHLVPNAEQEDSVYDDLFAKVEGYQRAVNAAALILSIRAIVVEKRNLTNIA